MWKLILGFLVFAAVAMWLLSKAGGDVDISGEKHGIEVHDAAPAGSAAASAAPAATASGASNP